jgi:hypothetical protein
MGVARYPSIGPSQRDIDDSALPGHPHSKSLYGIDRFQRMEANSALSRAPDIVMNHSESTKYTDIPIVQSYGYGKLMFSHRIQKEFSCGFIQVKHARDMIELVLGHFKGIKEFCTHHLFPL